MQESGMKFAGTNIAMDVTRTLSQRVDDEIQSLEQRLKDKQELKALLESEPKLSRAFELLSRGGIGY